MKLIYLFILFFSFQLAQAQKVEIKKMKDSQQNTHDLKLNWLIDLNVDVEVPILTKPRCKKIDNQHNSETKLLQKRRTRDELDCSFLA